MKYPVAKPVFHGNERKYLIEAFDSSWISSAGEFIDRFEAEFADFCGTDYALSCSNGTAALHLAMLALGIGPEDEVIVPIFTYIATANAVQYCGAKPVFVDCRGDTWNIDESLIEKKITEKTKAIIAVHLYGHPCEMEPIWKIADKYDLKVVEDAAEAHGAVYFSRQQWANTSQCRGVGSTHRVGTLGDIATFSLFGNKIITSGEGGVITTDDGELFERIRILRNQGMSSERRYWFPIVGYNYRMTNLQAAIALGQLEDIEWHLGRRREIAETYSSYLSRCEFISTPVELNNVIHSYWMYSITLTEHCSLTRDEVIAALAKAGIESRPFFYPLHQLPPYHQQRIEDKYPVADKISARGLSLPSSNDLSQDSIAEICIVLLAVVQQRSTSLDFNLRECQHIR